MPLWRIFWRGGPNARLFRFPASLAPAWLALTLCPCGNAMENPLQSILGLDYQSQLWMPIRPPDPDTAKPKLSAAMALDHQDLVHKTGSFAYDHAETISSLTLASSAIPGLDVRFALERSRRLMAFGDSSSGIGAGGTGMDWNGSVTYLLTPWMVPTLSVGGDSHTSHLSALEELAFAGAAPCGLAWSAAIGRKSLDYPVTLKVPDYEPISLPVQLRQDFRELGLRFHPGRWDAAWRGRWTQSRYPKVLPEGYSLADSGSGWKHTGSIAYDGTCAASGYRISMAGDIAYGGSAFRGANRRGEGIYVFSYQENIRKSYSLRADLLSLRHRWEWGAFAGGGESEYDAVRPDVPFNRHFWDRNGAIDSYQGGLLGVFNDETWLFNGAAYLAQIGAGPWAATRLAGWYGRLGLGYHYLLLQSNGHLTKRQTSFLLAYQEENIDRVNPEIRAHVLTPELRLEKSWRRVKFSATGTQALPVRVSVKRENGSAGSGSSGTGSRYSGGTLARLEAGWTLP